MKLKTQTKIVYNPVTQREEQCNTDTVPFSSLHLSGGTVMQLAAASSLQFHKVPRTVQRTVYVLSHSSQYPRRQALWFPVSLWHKEKKQQKKKTASPCYSSQKAELGSKPGPSNSRKPFTVVLLTHPPAGRQADRHQGSQRVAKVSFHLRGSPLPATPHSPNRSSGRPSLTTACQKWSWYNWVSRG